MYNNSHLNVKVNKNSPHFKSDAKKLYNE